MSDVGMTSLTFQPPSMAGASRERREAMLRHAVDEMVGVAFYGQMLKMSRQSALKGKIGHGGWGEDVFGAQLDAELARLAGQKSKSSLNEAVYRQLARGIDRGE